MDPAPDRLDAIAVGCFAVLVPVVVVLAWLHPAAPAAWILLSQLVASATLLAALVLGRPARRHR